MTEQTFLVTGLFLADRKRSKNLRWSSGFGLLPLWVLGADDCEADDSGSRKSQADK
jgi:hypothetical protein